MQKFNQFIQARTAHLENLIATLEKRIRTAPEGKLRSCASKGKGQFYYRRGSTDRNGIYIPKKNRAFAAKLAQKDYEIRVVNAAKKKLQFLKEYLRTGLEPEEVYDQLTEIRKPLVVPIFENDDKFIRRWTAVDYPAPIFKEDTPEFFTDKGERVRSKSEVIIANMLMKYNIPYRYEYPMELQGIGCIHPDFTVLNVKKRKEIIWEHFGRMDDPVYVERNMPKILSYFRNGYFLDDGLLFTFETNAYPLSTRLITQIIEHYFL